MPFYDANSYIICDFVVDCYRLITPFLFFYSRRKIIIHLKHG